ncbi:hypothetical protein ACVIGA_008800 [Bradyrhizobium sp. USDA 3240]
MSPKWLRSKLHADRIVSILRIATTAIVVAICFYLLIFHPSAPTIAVINATTEAVSFDVAVPEIVQVRLDGFALYYQDPDSEINLFNDRTPVKRDGLCLTGILEPQPNTRVTYKRFGKGPLNILFERSDGKPAASFELNDAKIASVAASSSWIRLEGQSSQEEGSKVSKQCEGKSLTRLPIYGIASLGTEMRPVGRGNEPSAGLLVEGTINVFAETLDFGLITQGATRIYPASDSNITLPPGSRVSEYSSEGKPRHPWYGFIEADVDRMLHVALTTPSINLSIQRPGIGTRPEVISVSLFTQLWHDPALVSLQIIAAFMFSALHLIGTTLSSFAGGQRREASKIQRGANAAIGRLSKRIRIQRNRLSRHADGAE